MSVPRAKRDAFGREDLPFMDPAGKYAEEIPCHTLLGQINETHRRGLDVGAGMMPETGVTNMAERVAQPTPWPEG
ncbi:hypothetical protein [Thiocapsa sp.]|uniref:hypothetical protein n=1 Tax=Thiocapsa sp. TaxID=2024551 RepID=UPI002CA71D71|nr:hypothetical protein [Thiocapsa sp.]HSO83957.1 hypothetical protein [Thiocapsa sp.]